MEPYRGGGGEGSSSMEPYRSGGGEGGFADAADLSEIAPSHRGLNAHAAAVVPASTEMKCCSSATMASSSSQDGA